MIKLSINVNTSPGGKAISSGMTNESVNPTVEELNVLKQFRVQPHLQQAIEALSASLESQTQHGPPTTPD